MWAGIGIRSRTTRRTLSRRPGDRENRPSPKIPYCDIRYSISMIDGKTDEFDESASLAFGRSTSDRSTSERMIESPAWATGHRSRHPSDPDRTTRDDRWMTGVPNWVIGVSTTVDGERVATDFELVGREDRRFDECRRRSSSRRAAAEDRTVGDGVRSRGTRRPTIAWLSNEHQKSGV